MDSKALGRFRSGAFGFPVSGRALSSPRSAAGPLDPPLFARAPGRSPFLLTDGGGRKRRREMASVNGAPGENLARDNLSRFSSFYFYFSSGKSNAISATEIILREGAHFSRWKKSSLINPRGKRKCSRRVNHAFPSNFPRFLSPSNPISSWASQIHRMISF